MLAASAALEVGVVLELDVVLAFEVVLGVAVEAGGALPACGVPRNAKLASWAAATGVMSLSSASSG